MALLRVCCAVALALLGTSSAPAATSNYIVRLKSQNSVDLAQLLAEMEALNSNGEDSAAIANVYRVLDCGGEGKPCALHGFAVSVTDDVLKVLKAHELVLDVTPDHIVHSWGVAKPKGPSHRDEQGSSIVFSDEPSPARGTRTATPSAPRSRLGNDYLHLHRDWRAQGARDASPAAVAQAAVVTQTDAPFQLDRIDERVGTDGTFSYSESGAGVDVYILDSGINIQNVDFSGRIGPGQNFAPDQAPADFSDCAGHGTHVSGLAAGTTYGVAKTATIIPVRIYDCTASGPLSQALDGINYVLTQLTARAPRRAVINMSFGGGSSSILNDAVATLVNAGAAVFAAAGNEAVDACTDSPSGAPDAFSVAASGMADEWAYFSNFGSCVSMIAPGENLVSDWIGGPGATHVLSGTSMSSPIVAGVGANVFQANPGMTVAALYATLKCSGTSGVVTGVPTTSTPDLLVYAPPGGFPNGGCVSSGGAPPPTGGGPSPTPGSGAVSGADRVGASVAMVLLACVAVVASIAN